MLVHDDNEAHDDVAEVPPAAPDGDAAVECGVGGSAELWNAMLRRVVNNVVVLKVTQTRAFDTESAGSSSATGFVVDAARGLILTNRHVVTPGPCKAEALFQNREEVPVLPLYYDPIHDFGIFRFDPSALQFMKVGEIPLAPDAAEVGLEIRVVGNDSGEKLSILSGTIARMDRDAPRYGKGYNDFNVWYVQAASGTKGGSSGSPVLDIHGRAVALNAGGKTKASSAYYFPLHRVVRALGLLRECWSPGGLWRAPRIPRGDLQATFLFKGFDEVKRLGLRPETEAAVRVAQHAGDASAALEGRSTGLLVVDSIVPGGPADGVLDPGDVVVRLDGAFLSDFLTLEAALDSKVGGKVRLEVERGGRPLAADIQVQDLFEVTPRRFLELGGGVVHELSYQQARNNRTAVGQVYVAEPGYLLGKAGVPKHAVIAAVNGRATPGLEAFAAALRVLGHGDRCPLEFFTFDERFRRRNVILHVDWCWYGPPLRWERDDAAGVWDSVTEWPDSLAPSAFDAAAASPGGSVPGSPGAPASPRISSPRCHPSLAIPRQHSVAEVSRCASVELSQAGITAVPDDGRLPAPAAGLPPPPEGPAAWRQRLEQRMRAALVAVDVEIPLVALADGVYSHSFAGCGVVVHQSERCGVVLVDRNTVAIGPGDVMLSFGAAPAELPARVRFLHPLHNFALLSYDPGELSEEARALVAPAPLAPAPALRRGDDVELVCLTKSLRVLHRTSAVTNPAMAALIAQADVPRFRAVNEEVIKLDQDFGVAYAGVLTNRQGEVRALWGSFSEQTDKDEREWTAGLAAGAIAPWVDSIVRQLEAAAAPRAAPAVRVLDAELEPLLLSKAAQFGLPPEWVARLAKMDPERRQVLRVRSTVAGSSAREVLRDGDMVLAVGGRPVSSFGDVEREMAGHGRESAPPPPGSNGVAKADDGSAKRACDGGRVEATSSDREGEEDDVGGVDPPGSDGVQPALPLTLFRGGAGVVEAAVRLGMEDGLGTDRLVHWCGAQLQAPHRGVREMGFVPDGGGGVYISRWHHGSPAHRYSLYALHWVTEVNGRPTPDLDSFLQVVGGLGDGADVRLKVVHYESTKTKVMTLKTDLRYWPTWELRLDAGAGEWTRQVISPQVA